MWRETGVFLSRHWLHLLLFVPGALVVTVLHEAAHAVAAVLQGGTLLEFVWLPGGGHWGYVSYDFPEGVPYSAFAISIAPYVFWFLLATLALLCALLRRQYPFWLASFIYLWLFLVPLADIANAAFPYLRGGDNDFHSAFGPPSALAAMLTALSCALALVIGYPLQRRLYREQGLGLAAYLALSLATLAMIGVVSGGL